MLYSSNHGHADNTFLWGVRLVVVERNRSGNCQDSSTTAANVTPYHLVIQLPVHHIP